MASEHINDGGRILTSFIKGDELAKALAGGADYLVLNKEMVNELNVFPVPDGDTGTNMSLTIKSAVKQVNGLDDKAGVADVALAASRGALMGARGNSGVILSQYFRGFSEGLKDKDKASIKDIAYALKKASDMTYKAVMKPTEGTILTVGRELGEYAIRHFQNHKDISSFLKAVIDAGQKSLDNTPNLLPVLKEQGVVDAGGQGLIIVLRGILKVVNGEIIESVEDDELKRKTPSGYVPAEGLDEDIEFGYCTEFIISGDDSKAEDFKKSLIPMGDCILVVGGGGIIKTHIHTNNPGKVLEMAIQIGALQDIKIDNMRIQHKEKFFKDEEVESAKNANLTKKVDKEYAFVAVSIGDGLDKVFDDLNVDYIVRGGQTMNPSTEDLLKGVEASSGKNVFILPNNKNILLAAKQVDELTDRNVIVIESRSIPEGISALLAFNPEADIETNKAHMQEALEQVTSASVTYAVRDTEISGKTIKEGDIIGLDRSDILEVGSDITSVTKALIESLNHEDYSVITLYYGEDVDKEDANELLEMLEEEYDEMDIELIYGGQPLYYYLISLE